MGVANTLPIGDPYEAATAGLLPANIEVVWQAIPESSQELALSCPADQILYHGTRGPGKTDTQLMRFARMVGRGYGKFWAGIIFDREYKSLTDLISKSQRWFHKLWTEDEAWFLSSNSQLKWEWATGETLEFRIIDDPDDYWKYHGQEKAFIGWNELTQWPTSDCYDIMQSINRTSFTPEKDSPRDAKGNIIELLPPIPLENFATTNSFGVGHHWVKNRFINVAENGHIVTREVEVIDPKTKKEVVVKLTQCAIFGSWLENIYLSPKYIATLKEDTDENRKLSWFTGSWDITAGGAIDDVWNRKVHVVPRFKVPKHWRILDRSYDDGSTHPFSVGWWAEANGDEVDVPVPTVPGQAYGANGYVKWCPQAGSLIQLAEWYGTAQIGTNKGLKLGSKAIGKGIADRELALLTEGWIHRIPMPGPADNRIRRVDDSDNDTPEKVMQTYGIYWEESDKTPGARIRGLSLVRERLQAGLDQEGPAIYFMSNCVASISTIPILPRHKTVIDDVDTKAEDHPYDMVRYRVLAGNLNAPFGLTASFPT